METKMLKNPLLTIALVCLPIFSMAQTEKPNFSESCSTKINGVCQKEIKPVFSNDFQNSGLSFRMKSTKNINPVKMSQLLSSVGLCSKSTYNYGQSDCTSLLPRVDLLFHSSEDGQTGKLTILVNHGFSTTTGQFVPSYFTGTELELSIFSIHEAAGFEARGYSHAWGVHPQLVSVQVDRGNLADSTLDFELRFGNDKLADGQMTKCPLAGCGQEFNY
jgi:hypothetical protein